MPAAAFQQADSSSLDAVLSTIAFGSCQNPRKSPPSSPWPFISSHHPDLFIWSGDVTYAKGNSLEALKNAFADMPKGYTEFAAKVPVVGTWDDHDFGVNDGGAFVDNREDRRDQFLDFLKIPLDSPRRNRLGVYASHDFGLDNKQVRVILMDTRFDRSNPVLPLVGHLGSGTFCRNSPLLLPLVCAWFLHGAGLFFSGTIRGIFSAKSSGNGLKPSWLPLKQV